MIKNRPKFSRAFIDRSTNFRLTNVIDHAKLEIHNIWLRAGVFHNRPGTWFDTNHFVNTINRWKASDKGTEKHDKTSKNRTL